MRERTKGQRFTASGRFQTRLSRRYRAERRFRLLGAAAVTAGMLALLIILGDIVLKGWPAFLQTYIGIEVEFDPEVIDPAGTRDPKAMARANYQGLVKDGLRQLFPGVDGRRARRDLYELVSSGAGFALSRMVKNDPSVIGATELLWLPADDDVDVFFKAGGLAKGETESARLNERQVSHLARLEEMGRLDKRFSRTFLFNGDSREPELAGIWGAAAGSMLTLLVTLLLSFPIGVGAALYLEEFAPKNRWTDLVEVNINNLAAVPSIVFGLLGLAVFLNFFGMPRSAPLVGGVVLALMTLPTIIISARAALKSVPPSIREAALGIGASRMQTVTQHVLPLALPGMLTGTIIGMAQALGETAPLLMIGMVAFIVDIPGSFTDPATVLPVQIFLWADSPERAFVERTSGAIMVLLAFLVLMNGAAALLRRKFERRW